MPQPTSPRAPKVADRRNHGVARGNEKGIPPNPCPRWGAVPVRRREERVCGDAAITQESNRPLGAPCPLSSPAAGRRHLPSPPHCGKSDASGSSLPAGTRRKRRAAAGVGETAEQRGAPWAEGPGSEVLSWGREVPGGDRSFRGKAARDGEPPPPAPRPASLAGPERPSAGLGRPGAARGPLAVTSWSFWTASRKWFWGRCLHLPAPSVTALP